MRLEDIRQQYKDEFVLVEITRTEESDITDILEGNVLAHSKDREEILDLMIKAPPTAKYVTVEWCGEIDPKVAVVL